MAPPMGGLPMGGLPSGMAGTPDFSNMSFPTPSYAGSSVFSSSDGDYDDDDRSSGLWGPDPDEDDPLVYFHRASKKGKRKSRCTGKLCCSVRGSLYLHLLNAASKLIP